MNMCITLIMDLQLFSPAMIIFSQPAINMPAQEVAAGGGVFASYLPVGVFTAALSASLISLVDVGFFFSFFSFSAASAERKR